MSLSILHLAKGYWQSSENVYCCEERKRPYIDKILK